MSGAIQEFRSGALPDNVFERRAESFKIIPKTPFCYWVSDETLSLFRDNTPFASEGRIACDTNPPGDDQRFIRIWWETIEPKNNRREWIPYCKGGKFSRFYADVHLVVLWNPAKNTFLGFQGTSHRPMERPASLDYFFRPGLTWSRRTSRDLSMRVMPSGCIFAQKGPGAFVDNDDPDYLFAVAAIMNSSAYMMLLETQLAAADAAARAYDIGVLSNTPFPVLSADSIATLAALGRRSWSLGRKIDTTDETSHAFLVPHMLEGFGFESDHPSLLAEMSKIQNELDVIVTDLYGFSDADRAAALGSSGSEGDDDSDADDDADDGEEDDGADAVDQTDGLLSWAAGVAFGRFDWRLATCERDAPPEPDPFDPLPAKSPGMLPDDAEPFHAHSGILVDDQGHPDDLARLIEEVLARVEAPVPADVRRWLQRDFFPLHLKQYSKSRRKAPIYWPISTSSGSYTLWLYYPSLTDQTLFTAVNDFIEPKLKQVGQDVAALRNKGSTRSAADEKSLEKLQSLEAELTELREALLEIAPTYRPNYDDGVQITAAPLWRFFRHRPWQNTLKTTWEMLENGDYDWAHLAMGYWPDRVREKFKTDKSLAIAHDLEGLYEEPEVTPGTKQGRKKTEDDA